jgi:hypothetical protein
VVFMPLFISEVERLRELSEKGVYLELYDR